MNMAERKAQLEKELEAINLEIQECDHDYGEARYDPEIVKVPSGYKQVQKGSDIWTVPDGYKEEKRDRWSITCQKCGHKIYTTQTVPTGHKPVF